MEKIGQAFFIVHDWFLTHEYSLLQAAYALFEKTDPLAALTATMAGLEEGEGMVVQLLIQPGGDWELVKRAKAQIARIERRRSINQPAPDGKRVLKVFRDYTPEEEQRVTSAGGKMANLPFRVALRLLAVAPSRRRAYVRLRGLVVGEEAHARLGGDHEIAPRGQVGQRALVVDVIGQVAVPEGDRGIGRAAAVIGRQLPLAGGGVVEARGKGGVVGTRDRHRLPAGVLVGAGVGQVVHAGRENEGGGKGGYQQDQQDGGE